MPSTFKSDTHIPATVSSSVPDVQAKEIGFKKKDQKEHIFPYL